MKKIKYLLPLFGLAFATSVLAYRGGHNFTGVSLSSSNGHNYKANYSSQGSFPFNGAGVFDGSKVNLKGTLTVTEIDGTGVNESYCFALSGTLKTTGGTVKTTQYTDTSCAQVAKRSTYSVNSYSEDGVGSFTTVATDAAGVVYTLGGTHTYQH